MAHILVVDGDSATRTLIHAALVRAGHHVVDAEDGAAALAAMQEERPDLVLTEIYMEGMDGIELLRKLRTTWPGESVVVMTSRDREGVEIILRIARLMGANGVVDKSMGPGQIVDAVRSILAS